MGNFLITSMKRKIVKAYIRWSSPEQAKGDSKNRQIEAAKKWCQNNSYSLCEENILIDEGLSAFKGDHRTKGQLGKLWTSLRNGEINPADTVLLTENLDRLSRELPHVALEVIALIEEKDLMVVTLCDGKEYRKGEVSKLEHFIPAIIHVARAHSESVMKSVRVGQAWANKRQTIGLRPYTRKRPLWIGYDEGQKIFKLIADRANVVRQIFQRYLDGYGTAAITCWLNTRKVKVWGRAKYWRNSYVKKILGNIATFGSIQPHTKSGKEKREAVGEPIEDYYPPVITKQTFDRAQLARSKRYRRAGRPSRNNGNLFPTICKCGFCGSSMHYVTKNSSKGEVYLVCSRARYRGGCRYISFPYKVFENSFLRHVRKIPFTEFGRGKEKLAELRSAQLDKEATLAAVERKIQNLANFAMNGQQEVKVLRSRMIDLEREQEGLVKNLTHLTKEMADLRGFDENSRTVTSLLEDEGMRDYLINPDMRHHLKEAVGKMVKEIQVFPAYNLDPRLRATRHFVVHFFDGTTQKCLGQGEPEMIYAKAATHEASWSPTFAQQHLTLLPSLSSLDSGKTEQAFTQPKAKKSS